MEIVIEGWRAGSEERQEAASVPAGKLAPLTDDQKSVAKKMGISEEDYARSAYAGRRNQDRLLDKTKRFAGILEGQLRSKVRDGRVNRIRLVTIEHEYRIELSIDGKTVPFRVAEDLVDDFLEKGFADAGRLIERNLETVLATQAA